MDRILEFITRSYGYYSGESGIINNVYSDFDSKDCFQHLFSVDISGDVVEVPVFLRNVAKYAIPRNYSEISLPIMNNNREPIISRRCVGTIMNDFLYSERLTVQPVVTTKGERYYGCPGIVLDQDYNPLIVLTCVISGGQVVNYRCRVSNIVFVHPDKLIEKTIIKKFLPTLATEFASTTPQFEGIFIGDINLVVKPVAPTPNKDINEDIKKFLIENIEEII